MSSDGKLAALAEEVDGLRREIAILEEQIEFQEEVSGDASLRAVVSETPLADRAADEAGRDLERMRRVQDEAKANLAVLLKQIDEILDAR